MFFGDTEAFSAAIQVALSPNDIAVTMANGDRRSIFLVSTAVLVVAQSASQLINAGSVLLPASSGHGRYL